MKRITVYTLSVAFLAAGMLSCGKTSRGKMINDWNVESSTSEITFLGSDGEKLVTNEVIMDNSITTKYIQTSADGGTETSSSTGKVNANSWAIKKDGTWTWTRELEYSEGGGQKMITEQSGTWSFIGKTKGDEFKKNERILFNILSIKNTTVQTSNGSASTSTSTDTYLTGETSMIFTVKESKKDELQMEAEGKNVYTEDSDVSTYTSKISVTLSAK